MRVGFANVPCCRYRAKIIAYQITVRDGAAALEFAFLVPAFLLLFPGLTEFGPLFWLQSMLEIRRRSGGAMCDRESHSMRHCGPDPEFRCITDVRDDPCPPRPSQ
jgi:TadE-like protein